MTRFNLQTSIAYIAIILYLSFQTVQAQLFVVQKDVITARNIQYFVPGDYDNDGLCDYLVYNFTERNPDTSIKWIVNIYHNDGGSSFTKKVTINSPLVQITPSWADIDNDGDLDILLSGALMNSFAEIYKNNGNNNFTKLTGITMSGLAWGASAWADYDKDGYMDVMITGHQNEGVTKLYHNNGNSTFTEQSGNSFLGVCYSSSVDWGDYDNDGNLDVLLTGSRNPLTSEKISVIYRNNGDGRFIKQTDISLLGISSGIATFGDYNKDGYPDILLAGEGYCKVYKNTGNGNFAEQKDIILAGIYFGSASWGDYDKDGYLDILLTGNASYGIEPIPVTKIYHNNKNGTFAEQTDIPLFTIIDNSQWLDYDNDGDLDILLYGTYLKGETKCDTTILYRNDLIKTSISGTIYETKITKVFPNPTNGIVNIIASDKSKLESIEITTLHGAVVYKKQGKYYENTQIDLSNKPKGVYLIKIHTNVGVENHKVLLK